LLNNELNRIIQDVVDDMPPDPFYVEDVAAVVAERTREHPRLRDLYIAALVPAIDEYLEESANSALAALPKPGRRAR
jgi:hypothetical protein